ncbi:MAG: phage tail tape measure protein, partial [Mycobacterium sp.]
MPTLSIAIDGRQALTAARALERAFGGVGASARRAEGGVQRFTRSINSQLRGLGSFRTGLTGIVSSFAAIGAARGAISTLGTFEQTLARVQGVLGATSGSAEELTSTIARVEEVTRELGATTPFTANEVARAFLNLSRAGLDAEESVAALRPTLDLALVAETDLARASDITASTLRQFGLAATDTERVVDVLTNTANSSNTTLLQLAEGFQLAAPNAAAAGLSLERTAAILGILADAGQKATVGGTQLRGIITALVGPSRAAEAALARLNVVQRENGDGSLRLVEILKTLGDANLSLGDAVAIFNRRQASGGLITSAAVDTINELTRANEDAAGVARENADLVGNTLPASFAALRSAVDEVVLSTGDNGLTATIRSVTDGLTLAVRAFGTTRDGVTTTTVVVRGLVAGLGAAGLLGALVSLGAFIGPAGIIVAGLSAAVGIFGSWATSTSAATVQQRELNAELRKLNVELDASEDAFTRARRAGDLFGQSQALQGRAQGLRRQASAIRDSGADRVRLLDRDSDPASGLQLTPRIRNAFSLALQEAIGDLGQQRVAAQNRLEGAGNRRQEFTAQSEVRQLTDRIDRLNTLQQQGTLSSRDLA